MATEEQGFQVDDRNVRLPITSGMEDSHAAPVHNVSMQLRTRRYADRNLLTD